jgi:hypothetical protein
MTRTTVQAAARAASTDIGASHERAASRAARVRATPHTPGARTGEAARTEPRSHGYHPARPLGLGGDTEMKSSENASRNYQRRI